MPGPSRPTPSSRREDKVQPPRPRNAWILYRSRHSALLRHNQGGERMAQSAISQIVSAKWREETEEVKRYYEKLADEEKLRHQQLYPNYRFCPQKKNDKLRTKGDKKARTKEAKGRDATPSDASTSTSTSTSATPAMPTLPALPLPFCWPDSMGIQQQYLLPGIHYGPQGPSPPLSASPSPASHETSHSPLPSPDESVASSSMLIRPSASSESLPTLLQPSVPSEQPLNASPAQGSSYEYTVAPQLTVWNNDNEGLPQPAPQAVKLTVPFIHTQNYPVFEQSASGSSLLDPMLSTDVNGVFDMSTIDTGNIMAHPPGELHVTSGDYPSTVDYHGEPFANCEYLEFQRNMASFMQADLTSPEAVALSPPNELGNLFHYPNGAEVEAYTVPQQRQSSGSSPQDLMAAWLNLDGTEGSTENFTTVTPQQMHLGSSQQIAAMAIFAQMTNVPTSSTPALPYVPPAGAANSSTRRVGGSWKPPLYIPEQTDDSSTRGHL